MSITADGLVKEVAKRMGQYIPSTPTANGAATGSTLVDSNLLQYLPVTLGANQEQFMPWVYGSTTVDAANQGVQRRATMWNSASAQTTLTFAVAWPTQITSTGSSGAPVYEIFLRYSRDRILEAINDAVGQIGLWWSREFVDTSITTANQTWSYTMPSTQYTAKIWQVEYQVDTNAADIGFPYADAQPLNWELREATDTSGVLTQTLQFGILPPPNRTLRIRGEAYYPDLSADSDVLAISGKWDRPCRSWIYKWSAHCLNAWQADGTPMGDVERYQKQEQTLLEEAERLRSEMTKAHKPGRIVVPGKNDGLLSWPNYLDSPGWLGSLHIGG